MCSNFLDNSSVNAHSYCPLSSPVSNKLMTQYSMTSSYNEQVFMSDGKTFLRAHVAHDLVTTIFQMCVKVWSLGVKDDDIFPVILGLVFKILSPVISWAGLCKNDTSK